VSNEGSTAMEVDGLELKGKRKAKADDSLTSSGTTQSNLNMLDGSGELAKVTFVLRLVTEVMLMYSSAVGVVLRRDSESSQGRGPFQGGDDTIGHGGLLYHILNRVLCYPDEKAGDKLNNDESREKLSEKAAYFLMAVCVRSGEGRRRVVMEIVRVLGSVSVDTESLDLSTSKGLQPPNKKLRALVDLINSILSSRASAGNAQAPGFSADMAKTLMDSGVVQALTRTLQVWRLNNHYAWREPSPVAGSSLLIASCHHQALHWVVVTTDLSKDAKFNCCLHVDESR
jgi:E3 ubiquitin-protein ligase HUWE1